MIRFMSPEPGLTGASQALTTCPAPSSRSVMQLRFGASAGMATGSRFGMVSPQSVSQPAQPLEQERRTVAVERFGRSGPSGRQPLWQAAAVLARMVTGVGYVLPRPTA